MINAQLNQRIHVWLTCLLAFFIPSVKNFTSPIIILIGILFLLNIRNFSGGFKNLLKNKALLLMPIYYVIYLTGLIYSENLKFGKEIIETKLSLLILPLIYSFYNEITRINLKKYLYCFISGCATYTLFSFSQAAYCFFKPVYTDLYGVLYNLGTNYFYYSYLSRYFHPSYTSMYSITAILAIIYLMYNNQFKNKILAILLLFIFSIYVFLLSSKAGWLILALLAIIILFKAFRNKKIIYGITLILFFLSSFFYLNIYHTTPFSDRIPKSKSILNAIRGKNEKNEKILTGSDGNVSRILVWKTSLSIFKNHFVFGVGTGDSKDVMMKEYQNNGMVSERNAGLNSHNQYLNTAVSLGIFGLVTLLALLVFPFYKSIVSNNFILYGFVIIVSINLLFESMFESQAGIVFFAFLNTIFCISFFNTSQAIHKT